MVLSQAQEKKDYNFLGDENLIILIGLSIGLFVNFLLPNDYLALLCSLLVCLYMFFCKIDNLLPAMVFFSLFAYIFYVVHYQIYIFVCISFIARAMISTTKRFMAGLILVPLYFIIHLLTSDIFALKLSDFIPFFIMICLYFACDIYKPKYRQKIIVYFLTGHVLSTIMGLFKEMTRLKNILDIDHSGLVTGDLTVRFSGLSYDANFYAIVAIVALCILLYNFDFEIKNPVIWVGLVIFTSIFGLLTYSKSYFLCFVLLLAFSLFKCNNAIKKKHLILGAVIIIGLILFWSEFEVLIESIIARFGGKEGTMDDLTTGRTEVWKGYIERIFTSDLVTFLFGHGAQYAPGLKAAHNTYLEILYKFGFVGFCFELAFLTYCYQQIKGKKAKNTLQSYLLAGLLILLFFNLSAYTAYNFVVSIFMGIILIKNDERQKIEKIELDMRVNER